MTNPPSEPEYSRPPGMPPESSWQGPASGAYGPNQPPVPPGPMPGQQPGLPGMAPGQYGPPPQYGGQPPYGGYGAAPAPYPPPKSKKGWIIGLSIGAVVLLLCCGCLGGGAWLFKNVLDQSKEDAKDAVAQYLEFLKDGDYDRAYDAQCRSLRNDETAQEFAARMAEPANAVTDYDVGNVSLGDGDVTYRVKVDITRGDGDEDSQRINVEADGDEPLVCSKI